MNAKRVRKRKKTLHRTSRSKPMIVANETPHPANRFMSEEAPDTYLVPNADGGWDEVGLKDPRLEVVPLNGARG